MGNKTCFIACPIGSIDSSERKNSDFLLSNIINPALTNFDIKRSDLISSSNKITEEIEQFLLNSDLVIVDLSSHNPNVFYELGFRHALQRPTIIMIKSDEKIPFDLSTHRTIHYSDKHLDVQSAIQQIKDTVSTFSESDFNFSKSEVNANNTELGSINRHLLDLKSSVADIQSYLNELPQSNDQELPADAITKMMDSAFKDPENFEKVIQTMNKLNQ